MALPQFSQLPEDATLKDVINHVHKLQKELTYILSTLETTNLTVATVGDNRNALLSGDLILDKAKIQNELYFISVNGVEMGSIRVAPDDIYGHLIIPCDKLTFTGRDNPTTHFDLTGATVYGLTAAVSSEGLHDHGIPDGTVLQAADGTTVIWKAQGSHSHNVTIS